MTERFDVVVIGAGLAGLWCARELARQGHRVAIVDRKGDVGANVRTTGIFVRKTFVETGLPHAFLGAPLRRVHLHGPRGAHVALLSGRDEFRIGRMPELLRHLLRQAIDRGATWFPHVAFESSTASPVGSTVRLRSRQRRFELDARFVVGADGARSLVARDLGLDANDRFLVGVEDVVEATADGALDALHCFLDAELAPGYIAWVAGDDGETHVGVAGELGRFDPGAALDRFHQRVDRRFGLGGLRRRERRGGLIPVNGILRRIASPRGLLLGDAAGAVSPLTAGGLDACIRLSGAAARLLSEALRKDDASLLSMFDGSRFRARFVSRLWMRRLLASFDAPLLLDTAVRMASVAPFRAVAHHVFFGRGSFPDVRFAFEPSGRSIDALPARGE